MAVTVKHSEAEDAPGVKFETPAGAADFIKAIGSTSTISKEDFALIEQQKVLKNIFDNPKLSRHQKKLQALPILSRLRERHDNRVKELQKTKEELAQLEHVKACGDELEKWLALDSFKLEKNDCSRLHNLLTAFRNGDVVFPNKDEPPDMKDAHLLWEGVHPFVVQHDWASAFANAQDYDGGEIHLPYPICAFEFRISGKNIVVQTTQNTPDLAAMPFVEVNGVWFCYEEKGSDLAPFQLAWEQIKAISVALEAEVATKTLTRASTALNKKREEAGRIPLYDYHVVGLRAHALKKFDGGGTHRSPRLHFRRGHWRHYPTHKTWIKWCLVGNPELGFIEKEYKL